MLPSISAREQLELTGLEESLRLATLEGATPAERRRLQERLEVTHQLLGELPAMEDIAFLHSGLCQTYLPHTRPSENHAVWRRDAGRFTLIIAPGILDERRKDLARPGGPREASNLYLGVPYGPKSRLILIYLQTEGRKGGPVVNMGPSMSAWISPSYSWQRPTAANIVGIPGGFAFWAVAQSATSQPPANY